MAQRGEVVAVYSAGMLQGLALVTFPAAGVIFTSAGSYDLSSTEYGAMFLPQAVMAIAASLLGAGLGRRIGSKRIFLLGLAANLLAMTLLVLSQFLTGRHALAYGILLAATTSLGAGFGLTVPVVNTLAAVFFPSKVDSAILVLNALLGLGTALAPALVSVFVGVGIWWGLPVVVGALILGLLVFSLSLPLDQGAVSRAAPRSQTQAVFPPQFWELAGFALLYGMVETMNGNWATLYMTEDLGASTATASLALTVFWGTVTGGRVLFALLEKWFPERSVYRVLPLVAAGAFVVTACLRTDDSLAGIAVFACAGLGCSALLPLTISFGEAALPTIASSVAGGLIACYQLGYGMTAFGVGPLHAQVGLSLKTIFGGMAVIALAMALLSFAVTTRKGTKRAT